ncbi:MAG: SUF system NifU family Fe-S cluster assembly protein [Candidatus Omnitrophota bacterium]|jgi:nitrogen fixation NifU-like protein|nr:MAG: SUF system NifU family Fe-S cluster assembly protein [Candidatus Omnitrophota bacterium]
MSEVRELYQEIILDHNKKPRNYQVLDDANHKADGHNPLCGDRVTIYVRLNGEKIENIAFQGKGCAISTASASLMTEAVKGKTVEEARQAFERFHDLLTKDTDLLSQLSEMGKLAALAGVRDFPMRVKCATLAWHTLNAALDNEEIPVSTE